MTAGEARRGGWGSLASVRSQGERQIFHLEFLVGHVSSSLTESSGLAEATWWNSLLAQGQSPNQKEHNMSQTPAIQMFQKLPEKPWCVFETLKQLGGNVSFGKREGSNFRLIKLKRLTKYFKWHHKLPRGRRKGRALKTSRKSYRLSTLGWTDCIWWR